MSDTAPHFIDAAKADAEATLGKASEAAQQGAETLKTTAEDAANRTADVLKSGSAAATENTKQSLASFVEINKAISDAYSQSLADMNSLAQQAFQVRTAKDLIAFQSDAFSQFQRNIATAANLYGAIWQTATRSFSGATDRLQDTSKPLRAAA